MQAVNIWQDSFTFNNSAGRAPTGVVCKDDGSSLDHGLIASITQPIAAGNNNAVMCAHLPVHHAMASRPAIPLECGWPGVALPGSLAGDKSSHAPPGAASAVCAAEALYDASWPLPSSQGDDDGLAQSAQFSRTAPFVALADSLNGTAAVATTAAAATSEVSAPGQSPRLRGAPGPSPASTSTADSSAAPTPLACPDPPGPPASGIRLADSSSINHPCLPGGPSTEQPQKPHHPRLSCLNWPAALGRPTAAAISPGPGVSNAAAAEGPSTSPPLVCPSAVRQTMRPAAAPTSIAGAEDGAAAKTGTAASFTSRVWAPCRLPSGRPHGQADATAAAECASSGLLWAPALRPEGPFDWGLELLRWEEGPGAALLSQAEFEERMALLNQGAWRSRPTRPIAAPAASLGRWLTFIAATTTGGGDGLAAATAIQSAGYGPARVAAKLAVAAAVAPAALWPLSRLPSVSGIAAAALDRDGPLGPYTATATLTAASAASADVTADLPLLGSTPAPRRSTQTQHPLPAAAAAAVMAAQCDDCPNPIDGCDEGNEPRPGVEPGVCEGARRSCAEAEAEASGSSEGGLLMATVARLAEGRTAEVGPGRAADGAAAAAAAAATAAAAASGEAGSRCDSESAADLEGTGAKSRDCTDGDGGGGGGEVGGCMAAAAAGVKRRREEELLGGVPHPAQRAGSSDPGLRREMLLSAIEEQLQLKPLPPPPIAAATAAAR